MFGGQKRKSSRLGLRINDWLLIPVGLGDVSCEHGVGPR